MSLSITEITADELAADYCADGNEVSSFSLTAGRGFPGVILDVQRDEMAEGWWITWEDGNGEHTFRADGDERIVVYAA